MRVAETGAGHESIAISFSGRTSAMIGLALKIFVLSLVTLTLYRFWGRSEVRRYLWSRIDINGEPVEYTGTGRELFLGFLVVVFFIILPLILAGYAISLFMEQGSSAQVGAFALLQVALVFLYIAGIYQAWRYRLSRTVWRGVRMALSGSALSFGLRLILLNLANVLVLGWLTPVVDVAFLRMMATNAWYGDQRFSFVGRARRLYGPFAASYLVGVMLFVILALVVGLLARMLSVETGTMGEEPSPKALETLLPIAAISFVLGLLFVFLASVFYRQRRLQIFGSGLRLGDLIFNLETGFWSYFRLTCGNFLIVLVTFGFGVPIAALRTFRYIFRRLTIVGMLDFGRIGQSTGPRPRLGEGLAEAFGLGNI